MKWKDYVVENVWVWAGTALVLLTLTGSTLSQALWITCGATLLHLLLSVLSGGKEDE